MERKVIIILLAIVALLIPVAIIGYMTLIPIVGDAIIQSDPKYPECKRLWSEYYELKANSDQLSHQVDSLLKQQTPTNDIFKSMEQSDEGIRLATKTNEALQLTSEKMVEAMMKCRTKEQRLEFTKILGPEAANKFLQKHPDFLD